MRGNKIENEVREVVGLVKRGQIMWNLEASHKDFDFILSEMEAIGVF